MTKITKRIVDSATPLLKDTYVWDSELSGFGLKITPSGRKVYMLQYRIGGRKGRTRRVTIGTHGAITTEQARSDAQALLRQVLRNEDPLAESDRKKNEKILGVLLDQFFSDYASIRLKHRSLEEYRRLISRLLPSQLRNMKIGDVSRSDISRLQQSLSATPYQANRLLAVLSKFFNWCEKHGFRADHTNPAYHVDKYDEKRRNKFLSGLEMDRLGETLASETVAKRYGPFVIAAIRLLALTGARKGEVLGLKWEWVDIENGRVKLPDSKTGAKTLYLNSPALQVLEELPRIEGNPFVICGERKGAHLVNLQKPWSAIRRLAGLDEVRVHDLRHTYASVAVSSGMSLPMIGALLGHSQPQTTARYAHLGDDPLHQASFILGSKLAKMTKGLT
jgi:integrase